MMNDHINMTISTMFFFVVVVEHLERVIHSKWTKLIGYRYLKKWHFFQQYIWGHNIQKKTLKVNIVVEKLGQRIDHIMFDVFVVE